MSSLVLRRFVDGDFVSLDTCERVEHALEVADSWLMSDGSALALGLHRQRFAAGVAARGFPELNVDEFFSAALSEVPRAGDWFPRVELATVDGHPSFQFRLREAPPLTRSVSVTSHTGADPRTAPAIKGPDLAAMGRLRTSAQSLGADESIILTPDGYVAEGASTSLVWWRGDILCAPALEFTRVDSVSARTLFGIAAALGVDTHFEAVTPAELDGTELWALNALHGIRIVTRWLGGPSLAEQPGRLALWRGRRDRLRMPLEGPTP